jgi:tetratricopeptide (TPR) repeat protein
MRCSASVFCLLFFLAALVLAPPASAMKRSAAAPKPPKAFVLESGLLAQTPEIAEALAAANETPDDPAMWRALGRVLAERGGFKDAIRAANVAVKLAPKDAGAWADLGAIQLRAGNAGAAKTSLTRALKIEPYDAIALYNLGLALYSKGEYDAALDAFERALVINPDLGDPTKNAGAVVNPGLPLAKLRAFIKTGGGSPAIFSEKPPEEAPPAPESTDGGDQTP